MKENKLEEEIAQLLADYIASAYAAMGRELPSSMDAALDVCVHWACVDKVASFENWLSVKTGEMKQSNELRDRLNFKFFAADGSVSPLG